MRRTSNELGRKKDEFESEMDFILDKRNGPKDTPYDEIIKQHNLNTTTHTLQQSLNAYVITPV